MQKKQSIYLPPYLAAHILIIFILVFSFSNLSHAAEKDTTAKSNSSITEPCPKNQKCAQIFVAPAYNCQCTIPSMNKTFTDNMRTAFNKVENGTYGPQYTVTAPKTEYVYLPAGTTWRVNTVDLSFKDEPFPCMIKIKEDGSGWEYAQGCSSTSTSANCTGCKYLTTPSQTNSDGYSMLNSGCPCGGNTGVAGYGHAYLLDYKNYNFLFRGPRPVLQKNGKWVFDQKGLLATLQSRAKSQLNRSLPDKFILVDISLIDDTGEGPQLNAEYAPFKGNSTALAKHQYFPSNTTFAKLSGNDIKGRFIWWQMLTKQAGGASKSNLDGLITQISSIMNKKHRIPYVLYFHCSAGEDRTGEVAISYLLKQRMSDTPEAAYIYGTTIYTDPDNKTKGRTTPTNPIPTYLAGANWYCQQDPKRVCSFTDQTTVPGKSSNTCEYPWSNNNSTKPCIFAGQN